jgi:signal transduction histidine kinase
VEAHATLAASRRITLESALDAQLPTVLADPERTAQVFSNLIDNALKFTPEGGRVRVTAAHSGTNVEFAVADTGPGISAEHLPHVFDRFWQAQSKTRGGTGLGLSIAKAIVEAHGGRIGGESALGAGTRFHFTLPSAGGAPEPPPA